MLVRCVCVYKMATAMAQASSMVGSSSMHTSKVAGFHSLNSTILSKCFGLGVALPKQIVARRTLSIQAQEQFAYPREPSSSLKGRLVSGGRSLYGAFLCSFSPALAEILGYCGFDYVVVDMEHGPGDTQAALPCLQALKTAGCFSVIRIPVNDPTWAKKALDLGPDGIMIPMVESSEEAARAVSACYYPPKGIRGAACGIIRASRYGLDLNYSKNVKDDLLVMLQIESRKGVENVASIMDVDGVHCLMMGPRDLSSSIGYLDNPAGEGEVNKLLHHAETVVLTSKKKGVYLAGIARENDSPTSMIDRGYHMVAGAVDLSLFRDAALANIRKVKPPRT